MISVADNKRFAWTWLCLFGSALVLYSLTSQRHCGWQDSGWFQYRALVEPYVLSDYTADLGLALGHPTYVLLLRAAARLFVFAPIVGVNGVSALGMAIAVANVGYLTFRLTGKQSLWPSVMAGVVLAFSHVVWWLSTIAEIYACVAAFLSTELICLLVLVERPSLTKAGLLAGLAGLHWGFHNFALLALPVYGAAYLWLVARKQLSVWALVLAAVCFLACAWPNVWMIAESANEIGWWRAVSSALVGKYGSEVLCLSPRWLSMVKNNAALFSLNFFNPAWALALVGLWQCLVKVRTLERGFLLAVLLVHGLFFVRYFVADQALFAVPTVMLLAIVAGIGAHVLRQKLEGSFLSCAGVVLFSAAFPVLAYLGMNALLHRPGFVVANHRDLPFRDEVRYWVLPWKHNERSAYLFKEEVFSTVEPDAVIIADSTAIVTLLLEKFLEPAKVGRRTLLESRTTLSVRPNAPLLSDFYAENADRPWYTVSPMRGYLLDSFLDGKFRFEKRGALYRIWPATDAGGT